ncbi:MAG: hypothetical protein EBS04_04700, partial [Chitinophagia bacterium]|nr:hypothetical protein [Chitinophagia bacterium]
MFDESSVKRIPGYTEEVKKYGVEIVGSIADLLSKVDFVCLETNDGRPHLQQALEVFKAGKPVFIDIEWETLNFDLSKIEEKITDKTVAIFLSPVLGNPPNMDELINLSNKYPKIKLLLDNCDSLGSKWNDKYLNEYAIVSSCSFYPAHEITTLEGGMVSSNIEEIIKLARSYATWGRDCWCIGTANLLCQGSCNKRFSNWLQ